MANSAKERFYEVMNALNLNDYRVYTDVPEITKNMMVKLRKGETSEVSTKILMPFLIAYPEVNADYILTGRGEMLKDDEAASYEESVEQSKNEIYTTYLLPMSAMGGSLTGFSASGTSLSECELVVSPIKNVDFAITVYGESMAPEYPSGSRILIKKINPSLFIDWGKVYVLDTPNGVVVKEVIESKKEGCVTCHSINPNPKFTDFDVPLSEIYGMYRVLMCLSIK